MNDWSHQPPVIERLAQMETAILKGGMGVGKTYMTIEAIKESSSTVPLVLVLCPKRGWRTWVKHTEQDLFDWRVVNLCTKTGTKPALRTLQQAWQLRGPNMKRDPMMVLCNFDKAWRSPLAKELLCEWPWTHVIYDESHKIKGPKGRASMFAAKLRDNHPDIPAWALTGTLMPHSPLDVFAQVRAVHRPMLWGNNYYAFRKQYCVLQTVYQGTRSFQNVVSYKNLDELASRLEPFTITVERDVLKMREPVVVDHEFDLFPKTKKLYDAMETNLAVSVKDFGVVKLGSALVTDMRLQQLTGGTLATAAEKDDYGEIIAPAKATQYSDEKELELTELLEDLEPEEPCVVFARFRPDLAAIDRAAKAAGRPCYELSGARDEFTEWDEVSRAAFQQGEAKPVLAVQIRSGAESNDMTAACHAVFYSTGYEGGLIDQAMARVHRPPQSKPVYFHYLTAKGTVDEDIRDAYVRKRSIVELVMERLRERQETSENS